MNYIDMSQMHKLELQRSFDALRFFSGVFREAAQNTAL